MQEESPQAGGNGPTDAGVESQAQAAGSHDQAAVGASAPPAPEPDSGVPERQWELPVGFCEGCKKPVTLRELADGSPPLLPADSLTDEQRTRLVASRIMGQQKFSLSVYGVGLIDKERAVREVEEGSRIGKSIARVEMMMIQEMIGLATGKGLTPNS